MLNDLALDLQMELYSELLEKVGQERFSAAYKSVLKTSKFRPDISELYEAAGVQVLNPHHEAAMHDLQLVINHLRVHGPKRNQSWVDVNDRSKGVINATRLPESAERALAEVGWGDIKAGLAWAWLLPVLDQVRDGEGHPMEEMPFRSQDKLEARWVQAWIKAQKGQSGE